MSERRECMTCKHGVNGLIYVFCREPTRMRNFEYYYQKGEIPSGGFPQSYNHVCDDYERRDTA